MSVKITGLPLTAGINATDLFEKVNDPGGTPVSQRCTAAQIAAALGVGVLGVKVYRALLTQTGTDAPVATVLENSLGGTVVWTRDSTGQYSGTLSSAFTQTKTASTGSDLNADVSDTNVMKVKRISNDVVQIRTGLFGDAKADDLLSDTFIQILVYP